MNRPQFPDPGQGYSGRTLDRAMRGVIMLIIFRTSALILNITAPDTGHTTVQCQCRGKARPLREPSRLPLPRPRTEHHDGDASSHCLGSGRLGQPFRPGGLLILPDGPGALVANLDLPSAAGSGRGT